MNSSTPGRPGRSSRIRSKPRRTAPSGPFWNQPAITSAVVLDGVVEQLADEPDDQQQEQRQQQAPAERDRLGVEVRDGGDRPGERRRLRWGGRAGRGRRRLPIRPGHPSRRRLPGSAKVGSAVAGATVGGIGLGDGERRDGVPATAMGWGLAVGSGVGSGVGFGGFFVGFGVGSGVGGGGATYSSGPRRTAGRRSPGRGTTRSNVHVPIDWSGTSPSLHGSDLLHEGAHAVLAPACRPMEVRHPVDRELIEGRPEVACGRLERLLVATRRRDERVPGFDPAAAEAGDVVGGRGTRHLPGRRRQRDEILHLGGADERRPAGLRSARGSRAGSVERAFDATVCGGPARGCGAVPHRLRWVRASRGSLALARQVEEGQWHDRRVDPAAVALDRPLDRRAWSPAPRRPAARRQGRSPA